MEVLFELLFELLIQVAGEALVHLGFRGLTAPFRKEAPAWLAAIGYAALGAALGAISLLIWPEHKVSSHALRWVNLAVSPVLAGLCMGWLGAWRERRGLTQVRIDKFSYGYVFALSLATVRWVWVL